MDERRKFDGDQAKFSTQKVVTYILLLIFASVTANVLAGQDQAERSMLLQTVINLTLLAVGYWLGSSKAATDTNAAMGRIIHGSAPAAAATGITASTPPPIPEDNPPKQDGP